MIRLALAYLAIAVVAILTVTGLPFGRSDTDPAAQIAALSGAGSPLPPVAAPGSAATDLAVTGPAAPAPLADTSIAGTTALILKQLATARAPGDPALSPATFAALQSARTPGEVTLENLLVQAIAAGQTAGDIDRLLNAAVGQGSVRVPAMMVTTEGRVDTPVLIASILAKSLTSTREQGDTSVGDSFVTPETAILDLQDIDYTVVTGDSLGSLSLKFYGTPARTQVILSANRDILATPTSLRAGQVLVIPSRSKL